MARSSSLFKGFAETVDQRLNRNEDEGEGDGDKTVIPLIATTRPVTSSLFVMQVAEEQINSNTPK
jgi:hypothetical protein